MHVLTTHLVLGCFRGTSRQGLTSPKLAQFRTHPATQSPPTNKACVSIFHLPSSHSPHQVWIATPASPLFHLYDNQTVFFHTQYEYLSHLLPTN
ncbi:hypothetical protein V8C40DRAFT_244040 [Trichoderma camerunense]